MSRAQSGCVLVRNDGLLHLTIMILIFCPWFWDADQAHYNEATLPVVVLCWRMSHYCNSSLSSSSSWPYASLCSTVNIPGTKNTHTLYYMLWCNCIIYVLFNGTFSIHNFIKKFPGELVTIQFFRGYLYRLALTVVLYTACTVIQADKYTYST